MPWKGTPLRVKKLEAKHPGMKLCYHCRKLKHVLEDFTTVRTRECKACRSIRSQNMSHDQRINNLLCQARARALVRGVPFTLKMSDIVIPKRCPVLGIFLRWGKGTQRDHSPSIDCIVRRKGYVKSNILIVSWRANNIRRAWPPADLMKVAKFYAVVSATR